MQRSFPLVVVFALAIVSSSFVTAAGKRDVVTQFNTAKAEGVDSRKKIPATEATLETYFENDFGTGEPLFSLVFFANQEADIYIGGSVPRSLYPLRDGTDFRSHTGDKYIGRYRTISYRGGVLMIRTTDVEIIESTQYDLTEDLLVVHTSPDLKHVTHVEGHLYHGKGAADGKMQTITERRHEMQADFAN